MWYVAQLLLSQHMPCWIEDSCRSWRLLMHWQRHIPYSGNWNEDTDEDNACVFFILSLSCYGKVKRISMLQISQNVGWHVTNNALKVGPKSWKAMKIFIMFCPKSYLYVPYSYEGNVVVKATCDQCSATEGFLQPYMSSETFHALRPLLSSLPIWLWPLPWIGGFTISLDLVLS